MPRFKTIQDVEKTLAAYIPAMVGVTGKDITLERMWPLMSVLGNPQEKLKIIHVAGTSGKTSTAYYIASLLQAPDRTVGLTVSPHMDSITERVQINSQPISEPAFCEAMDEFMPLIESVQPQPTYFELLIAFVYWYFAKIEADYVVVETGLGGLHDGTNVVENKDKVCVITDIGLDHTHILGTTLPEISAQKAGIIHAGNHAFMLRQTKEVNEVFEQHAKTVKAQLTIFDQSDLTNKYRVAGLEEMPLFQQRNWLLARATCSFVAKQDGLVLHQDAIHDSLDIQVPGRMDEVKVGDKLLIMDGAHNEQKMHAFISSFRKKYPNTKAAILLSLKQGKEYEAVLPLLQPVCAELIVTGFQLAQDVPVAGIDPEILAQAARQLNFRHVRVAQDPKEAYGLLSHSPEKIQIITGSFYLLAMVRRFI